MWNLFSIDYYTPFTNQEGIIIDLSPSLFNQILKNNFFYAVGRLSDMNIINSVFRCVCALCVLVALGGEIKSNHSKININVWKFIYLCKFAEQTIEIRSTGTKQKKNIWFICYHHLWSANKKYINSFQMLSLKHNKPHNVDFDINVKNYPPSWWWANRVISFGKNMRMLIKMQNEKRKQIKFIFCNH